MSARYERFRQMQTYKPDLAGKPRFHLPDSKLNLVSIESTDGLFFGKRSVRIFRGVSDELRRGEMVELAEEERKSQFGSEAYWVHVEPDQEGTESLETLPDLVKNQAIDGLRDDIKVTAFRRCEPYKDRVGHPGLMVRIR